MSGKGMSKDRFLPSCVLCPYEFSNAAWVDWSEFGASILGFIFSLAATSFVSVMM